eukprot:CAMPEP_0181207394 /NCGR_PEP_ID=MMETSP1096-20121128/21562_1 /TAXON_ID=156174 ORGANISM="Chrysochromulina ericina, Strain CCMP281" /NCGR_SAMPLE_ID=MMETSP1096 /ASSEMBLY_ACC=CAM_ASM_000453 /LENGTH=100 /DNA_ID=CAMNT_0023298391 /DNA_START=538 /DNA_END=841 /DNA_ORIENTATION=-
MTLMCASRPKQPASLPRARSAKRRVLHHRRAQLLDNAALGCLIPPLPREHLLGERQAARAHLPVREDLGALDQVCLLLPRPLHEHLNHVELAAQPQAVNT